MATINSHTTAWSYISNFLISCLTLFAHKPCFFFLTTTILSAANLHPFFHLSIGRMSDIPDFTPAAQLKHTCGHCGERHLHSTMKLTTGKVSGKTVQRLHCPGCQYHYKDKVRKPSVPPVKTEVSNAGQSFLSTLSCILINMWL